MFEGPRNSGQLPVREVLVVTQTFVPWQKCSKFISSRAKDAGRSNDQCFIANCIVMSRHVTSCHVIVTSCHVLSRHVTSCHVTSRHVTSCHVLSHPVQVMSCHVLSRHVTLCQVMSSHVTSCHVTSCHVLSCHVTLVVPKGADSIPHQRYILI